MDTLTRPNHNTKTQYRRLTYFRKNHQGHIMFNIHFELTKNPDHLSSYYKIRETCFRKDLLLSNFNGSEDKYDKEGHILIARVGNHCIGGARINGNSPKTSTRLPIENDNFIVKDLFPDLALEDHSYCQWTRLALLPEYRTMDAVKALCLSLTRVSTDLGFKYAFNVTGSARARLYRRLAASGGMRYKICNHIKIPAEPGFNDLEHLLSIAILQENSLQISKSNRSLRKETTFFEPSKMVA